MPLAPPVMTATFPSSFPTLSSWTRHERDAYLPTVAAAEQDAALRGGADAGRRLQVQREVSRDHDAVVAGGQLHGDVAVEHVPEHALGRALAGISVAAAARPDHDEAVAGARPRVRDLGRQAVVAAVGPAHDQLGGEAVLAAGQSPRRDLVAFSFHGGAPVFEIREL